MTHDYRELLMKMPPQELAIIRMAAKDPSLSNAIMLCSVYLPQLNAVEAKSFLDFLKKEHA